MDAMAAFEGEIGQPVLGTVEAAYAAYAGEIQRRLVALVHDEATAEDLAQEAFLKLHVEVAAGRAPGNTRAWLHRVVGNLAVSRGRRAQVAARRIPCLVAVDEASSTEELALRHEGDGRLVAALAQLPPADRRILMMAASGMSGPEIAGRIGRTHIATRTLLSRARGRLRQHVEALEATA